MSLECLSVIQILSLFDFLLYFGVSFDSVCHSIAFGLKFQLAAASQLEPTRIWTLLSPLGDSDTWILLSPLETQRR